MKYEESRFILLMPGKIIQKAKVKIRPVLDEGNITGCIMRIEEAEKLKTQ
jgi:hypothetical protein